MDFTREEIELLSLGLNGISFNVNVDSFKQVKQKIDVIEGLKSRLKELAELLPDQTQEKSSE